MGFGLGWLDLGIWFLRKSRVRDFETLVGKLELWTSTLRIGDSGFSGGIFFFFVGEDGF